MKTPYTLSTDYELLWNLIQEGNRLAGWAYNLSGKAVPRVTNVFLDDYGDYAIDGEPALGLNGLRVNGSAPECKEIFIGHCTEIRLEYIVPPINISSQTP